ncbi:hypothetical protein FHR61_002008 [Xanthomonas arboricola]|uniref:Uncharacterized protein n=1 Tax=Xanthomonas cannabis TaxID=1885674 RepID=A0ABR6JHB5_9XANT|nr:hypothetical protein [Xanthomonas cannabis]MBB4591843.1 hypothetical protein [Xanthomonas cannabis]MBB5522175.1 hypothetical protein [Xanthomonas cannabis]
MHELPLGQRLVEDGVLLGATAPALKGVATARLKAPAVLDVPGEMTRSAAGQWFGV